jgi:hypothetical protein
MAPEEEVRLTGDRRHVGVADDGLGSGLCGRRWGRRRGRTGPRQREDEQSSGSGVMIATATPVRPMLGTRDCMVLLARPVRGNTSPGLRCFNQ